MSTTEQEYLEMANHAKQLLEVKEEEIKQLKYNEKVHKKCIRKASKIILNLQENIKKMDFLVDFHKGNLSNIMSCFYSQLSDCVNNAQIELTDADLIPKFDDEPDDEEEEDINLTLHTILGLLGEHSNF
tara:strand:- start:215 stop:601 length:387 start_codon:yes stop_codon:yes gene_type:complete